jgi:hypothetical protein
VFISERGGPIGPIGFHRLIQPKRPHLVIQEHSAHGQVHRNGARSLQGFLEGMTLGLGRLGATACGRRQAPDDFRFRLNHFGHLAGLALRQHLPPRLQGGAHRKAARLGYESNDPSCLRISLSILMLPSWYRGIRTPIMSRVSGTGPFPTALTL